MELYRQAVSAEAGDPGRNLDIPETATRGVELTRVGFLQIPKCSEILNTESVF
jgi:hypothetical protein